MIESNEKKAKMTPKIKAMIKNSPAFDLQEIPELKDFKPGKVVARGFASFKEYIDKNDHTKTKDPKIDISIKIPSSYVTTLRATGRGWQTRVGEYLVNGIKRGDFDKISAK